MSPSKESLADRRKQLAEKAARERIELGRAYRELGRPFQYTQKAVVGLQAVRKNAWLVAMAPSVVKLAFSFFGWERRGRPSLLGVLRGKAGRKAEEKEVERVGAAKLARRWMGRGWSLFQLYRRVRPYFP